MARDAGVDLLVLTHVSSRHTRRALLDEARAVFPAVILPSDLDQLLVPYPDKGAPTHVRAYGRSSIHGAGGGDAAVEPVCDEPVVAACEGAGRYDGQRLRNW